MPEISDYRLGAVPSFAPLPPFATPEEVLADALPILDPPTAMSVTDAAEAYVRVPVAGDWGPFDRSFAPYMVEPADTTQSRRFQGAAFVGPAQSAKTFMLQTVAAHAVTCNPQPMLIVHMTSIDRNNWVEDKLDPMIRNSPALAERLGRGREDSTMGRKRFRGMKMTLGYATAQMLSSATYGMVLMTDYDRMKQKLGPADRPEGRPWTLARQRVKSYMSRGMVLAESAPSFPVLDRNWVSPSGQPHMMPPIEGGIVLIYNEGTRGRLYWECPDCGDEFEPRVDRLVYPEGLDPGAAGDAAEMACPHCGSLIAHRHKVELNRAILTGRGGWRHEAADGSLCALGDAALRNTDTASWALNGAAAAMASWRDIVAKLEAAKRQFAVLGDETDLATVHYNDIGVPFARPRAEGEASLDAVFLRDHAQETPRGVAPSWTRFVTISVDVQGTYFAVQVTAWDAEGNAQIVDRFDLTAPPATAPNAQRDADGNSRRLQPHLYGADWDVLVPLVDQIVPVEAAEYGLRPVLVGVDFHGLPGVSDNAEAFLLARRKDGQGARWVLTRGQGGFRLPFRVVYELPDRASKGKKARGVKLLTMAVDRLKDTVDASLRKAVGAKGAIYLGAWMFADGERALAEEMLAEERTGQGWEKKKGVVRNEGIDLTVQARALAEHKGLLKIAPDRPPAWALGGPENENAVAIARRVAAGANAAPSPGPDRAPPRPKRFRTAGKLF